MNIASVKPNIANIRIISLLDGVLAFYFQTALYHRVPFCVQHLEQKSLGLSPRETTKYLSGGISDCPKLAAVQAASHANAHGHRCAPLWKSRKSSILLEKRPFDVYKGEVAFFRLGKEI